MTDAVRSGGTGTSQYRFEIAADAGFARVVASGTIPEAPGQTSFTPAADLASGATYYWRVQASDAASGRTSSYSEAQTFTTVPCRREGRSH